jgi:hypothetical protein
MKPAARTLIACCALTAGAGSALPAGPATAAPPATGCPSAYQMLSVQALSSQGYRAPAQVDSPTSGVRSFGRAGNGDGLVCGLPLPDAACVAHAQGPCPVPVFYQFIDDQLPA